MIGDVILSMVGSGPGDPDLLTIAAHRIISDPNALIVADRLVSPEIIALCEGEVSLISHSKIGMEY